MGYKIMKRQRVRRRIKNYRRLVSVVAVVALLSFIGGQRAAADIEVSVDGIVEDYFELVLIDRVPTEVRMAIRNQFQLAIRAGIVDEKVIKALGYATTGKSEGSASTIQDMERLRTRLQEQLRRWKVIGPDWLEAYESVRARIQACRETSTPLCEEECRLLLQWNHMLQVREAFERRIQDENGDSAAIQELRSSLERAENRIRLILANGDNEILQRVGVSLQEMKQMQTQLTEMKSRQIRESSSSSSSTTVPRGKK